MSGYGQAAFYPSLSLWLVLTLLLPLSTISAQDRDVVLRAQLRIDLERPPSVLAFEGVTDPEYQPFLSNHAAAAAVLAEGLWLFYGMIHGFDFVYTPSDRARAIADLFKIQERETIPKTSQAFSVSAVNMDGRLLLAEVEYLVPIAQRAILYSWDSVSYRSAQGRGTSPAWERELPLTGDEAGLPFQVKARRAAIVDASREAIRDQLRGLEFNKPREVRGSFSFASQPRLVLSEGQWIATVRLRVRVEEIIPFGGY